MSKRILLIGLALCAAVSSAATADTRKWKTVHRVDCPTFPVGCSNTADMFSPQVAVDATGNAVAVWQVVDRGAAHILASRYNVSTLMWEASVPIDGTVGGASDAQVGMDAGGNAMIVWTQTDGVQALRRAANGTLGTITPLQAIMGHGSVPQVAVFPNGDAIAVWHQSNGTRKRIYARRYTASTNQWEPTARTVDSDLSTSDATVAQVAADTSGNALVVWQQGDTQIGANRYSAGNWLGGTTLPSASQTASVPQVVIDARGIGRAVWVGFDASPTVNRDRIWSSRFVDQWEAAVPVEDNTGPVSSGNATSPSIAVDSNSNAVVVWTQFDGAHTNAWSSRYVANRAQWEGAALIESIDGNAISPAIAMDANGNALAVWQQPTAGSVTNIYAARYTPSAILQDSWAPAALIERDDSGSAFLPRVGFATDGTAMAVWYQSNGQRVGINSNRYGGPQWSSAMDLGGGGADMLQTAADTKGNVVAVYSRQGTANPDQRTLWANRFTLGSGWSAQMPIETSLAGAAEFPQIAFDADGNAIAVWGQGAGHATGDFQIWSNTYSVAENKWGTNPKLVVSSDQNKVYFPQVAFDASTNTFVAVWTDAAAHVLLSRYSNGNWSTLPQTIGSGVVSTLGTTLQLAVDANGNALVLGNDKDATRVWAIRYRVVGGPQPLEALQTADATSADMPTMTIDANGNGVVIWNQHTAASGSYLETRSKRYNDGTWGPAQFLSTRSVAAPWDVARTVNGDALAVSMSALADAQGDEVQGSTHYSASNDQWDAPAQVPKVKVLVGDSLAILLLEDRAIASDPNGNGMLVWFQLEQSRRNMALSCWASLYVPGNGWDTPFRLDNGGRSLSPHVVTDAQGAWHAVWIELAGSGHVWARRFE
jgi:hypothetical protein